MTHYTFAIGVDGERVPCWLAHLTDTPCEGRMDRAHLLPKQTIRRELRSRRLPADEIDAAIWDDRVWRPACRWHHGQLDVARRIRIPRSAIPIETVEYAEQWDLTWLLDRTYPQEMAAGAVGLASAMRSITGGAA